MLLILYIYLHLNLIANPYTQLYSQTPGRNPLAVATKNRHIINLEMSEQALLSGLLEPCIVAITLLLSGRRLE